MVRRRGASRRRTRRPRAGLHLLQDGVEQAQALGGGGQVGPRAVAQVAGAQRAQQAVRRPLATHKQQHGGDVVQALVVVQPPRVARHRGVEHAAQRGTARRPLIFGPPCSA